MRHLKWLLPLALLFAHTAFSQIQINALPTGSVVGGNYTVCDTGTVTDRCTFTQVNTWILSVLISGTPTTGHCAQWASATTLSDAGAACGSGSSAFSSITTGSNTTATMTVGTGGTLTVSGSGVVNANQVNGAAPSTSSAVAATNSSGQIIAATTQAIMSGYIISGLPTCNGGAEGLIEYVTNGQTSPTFLGTVSTTGAVVAPVFCNGTNWLYF